MVSDSLKPLSNDNILNTAEVVDLNERYGKEKCAFINLSSCCEAKDGKLAASNSNISKNVIDDIILSIINLQSDLKSSTTDNLFIRERNELYSGSYHDYREKHAYRFYSIDTSLVAVIDVSDDLIGSEDEPSCLLSSASVVDCEDGDNSECLGECSDDIDILFLWSDQAKNQFVSELDRIANLDMMVDQLTFTSVNSNINNNYSYNYSDYNYEITNSAVCGIDITTFLNNNPEVYDIRSAFGSDIVVFLSDPGERWDDALACVPDFGVDSDYAFTVIPVDRSLEEFIFPHEIGHLFGAKHGSGGSSETGCCGRGKELAFFQSTVTVFNSIMSGNSNRIPYYTDPNVFFEYNGEVQPVGQIFQGRMWNNAGLMRNYGCEVAEISPSINLNVSLTKNYENCLLNLFSNASDSQLSSDRFRWYSSDSRYEYDEINYLGEGYNLSIDDPLPDPCVNYFVHLVVENQNVIVHNSSVQVKGGICIDNVWCGDNNDN
jgi:hypothetical protein